MASKRSTQARARDRGRYHEYRSAHELGGYVYSGQDGDVVVDSFIVECKARKGFKLRGVSELGSWIEQAKRNAAAWTKRGQPKNWIIAFTGGGKSGRYVIQELGGWKELYDAARGQGHQVRYTQLELELEPQPEDPEEAGYLALFDGGEWQDELQEVEPDPPV